MSIEGIIGICPKLDIKELEEFLDPNVMRDEDFQIDQETKKQITVHEKKTRSVNVSKNLTSHTKK